MNEKIERLLKEIEAKEANFLELSEYERGVKDAIVFEYYNGSRPIIENE